MTCEHKHTFKHSVHNFTVCADCHYCCTDEELKQGLAIPELVYVVRGQAPETGQPQLLITFDKEGADAQAALWLNATVREFKGKFSVDFDPKATLTLGNQKGR